MNWLKKSIGQSVELKGPRENKERRSKPARVYSSIWLFSKSGNTFSKQPLGY